MQKICGKILYLHWRLPCVRIPSSKKKCYHECIVYTLPFLFFDDVVVFTCRAQLRMVEGLQSRDLATRGLVGSWVHFATARGKLQALVAPLVRIILDQDGKRKATFSEHPSDNGMKEDAGKYYSSPSHTACM